MSFRGSRPIAAASSQLARFSVLRVRLTTRRLSSASRMSKPGRRPATSGSIARGKAVERAEPGWRGSAVERRPDPAAHFGGGLVGEGDGENTARCDTAGRYTVHGRGG